MGTRATLNYEILKSLLFLCVIAFTYSKFINTNWIVGGIPSTHHYLLWILNKICTQILKYSYIKCHIHQYIPWPLIIHCNWMSIEISSNFKFQSLNIDETLFQVGVKTVHNSSFKNLIVRHHWSFLHLYFHKTPATVSITTVASELGNQ